MFSVGDEVVVCEPFAGNDNIHVGDVGIVCKVFTGVLTGLYGVDWGHDVDGHDCDGNCTFGNGWNVREGNIELLSDDDHFDISMSDIDQLLFQI